LIDMQLVQETPNLYRLTRFGLINCFLVREDDGLTVIDTGVWGSAPKILAAARSLSQPIRRILLTHAHFDHVASVDALRIAIPEASLLAGARESRILNGDRSLDPGETGKTLRGFLRIRTSPDRTLNEGDCVVSLQSVFSPGHTPGHMAFLDRRDGTLFAGDAFTTQIGVVAAGFFKLYFPFPRLFSWNSRLAAESALKLSQLKPSRLCVGHGNSLESPSLAMEQAARLAVQQTAKL
jgi:glyoxylase-like metal-dependent hydrolase (beta-lactamase superfamily II)